MSESTAEHRGQAPRSVSCFVVTVSDTRTVETDRSGQLIVEHLQIVGHRGVGRQIVPDEPAALEEAIRQQVADPQTQAVLLTGGTGIAPRDRTCEVVSGVIDKEMPGFGELFRRLSYEQIGPAVVLTRAMAGVAGETLILAMPGSSGAVRLAMEKIIVPELGHMVYEASKGR